MKKLTAGAIRNISSNLDYFFNIATKKEIKQGLDWYKNANSALSPRNKWGQNIKDANKLCEAYVLGLHPEDIKVCTFHTNKFKAFNILASNSEITANSLKTFNFVNNIAYLSIEHLTIDIWHLRACFFNDIKINSASIGKLAYEQIKVLTIKKANKLGFKGFELQAIIWLSAQKIFINNRKTQ